MGQWPTLLMMMQRAIGRLENIRGQLVILCRNHGVSAQIMTFEAVWSKQAFGIESQHFLYVFRRTVFTDHRKQETISCSCPTVRMSHSRNCKKNTNIICGIVSTKLGASRTVGIPQVLDLVSSQWRILTFGQFIIYILTENSINRATLLFCQ